jgi:predicted XRE-type DNA-binding protein
MSERPEKRMRVALTDEVIREIRRRLALGHYQHDIAADLGINQGRVSEVNTGKRRPANDNTVGLIS